MRLIMRQLRVPATPPPMRWSISASRTVRAARCGEAESNVTCVAVEQECPLFMTSMPTQPNTSLDALAAISAKRYPDLDPTTAFKTTLGKHVFQCPLARGEVHTEHLAAAQGHDKRKIGRFAGSATDGEFRGNTNTGTDQNIHDISTTFRTNLRVNQGRGRMHF